MVYGLATSSLLELNANIHILQRFDARGKSIDQVRDFSCRLDSSQLFSFSFCLLDSPHHALSAVPVSSVYTGEIQFSRKKLLTEKPEVTNVTRFSICSPDEAFFLVSRCGWPFQSISAAELASEPQPAKCISFSQRQLMTWL
jgi:hypothetical protein